MKKTIKFFLLSVLLLTVAVSAVGLAACKEAHVHTFAEDWQSDANNHWHAATCEHTDVQGDVAKHIDANNNGECDVCGYRPMTVMVGGTYYFCENDVTDDQLYITFANGKWTDDEGLAGDYVISGNTVTMYMQVENEKLDFAAGVVNGEDIALNLMGADVTYRKGEDISSKPKEKTLAFALSDDRTYYIVKGIGGLSGDIVVPDEYKRKPVKEIAEKAFANQQDLTSIVVGNNVTAIGAAAFSGCGSLTEVTLGESVKAISANTFDGCSTLNKITIPASVESIDYDAFKSCKALVNVYFTGAVSDWVQIKFYAAGNVPQNSNPISSSILAGSVEKNLYIDNEILTNAAITEAVEIAPVAFYSYKKLQSVTIGSSVKEIGRAAFSYCLNLSALDMSNSTATVIGDFAFSGCNALATVGVSDSVKKLGSGAFSSCENLTAASIGNGVTYIGDSAFMSCEKLSDLVMGNSVAEICEYTFYQCYALTSVTIPASAIFIGKEAFGYTGLTSATFQSTTGWVANKKDALTSEQLSDTANAAKLLILSVLDKGYVEAEWEKPTLTYRLSNDGSYYIVSNSGTVCRSEITIPEKYNDKPVRALATDAFKNCTSLVSITLPGAIMSIPSGAFYGCTSLENITVTGYLSGGYELVYGTKDGVLYNADFTQIVYIPLAKSEITISGMEIADEMFKNYTILKKVIIADGVTRIGVSAFAGCTNLTSITILDSVTTIGERAFYDCSSLTSIIIPNGVTEISDYAFSGCTSLTSVTMGNSVTTIGKAAFRECSSLTSITIPDSVTTIGSSAFSYCDSLTSVTIPNSVTTIGSYAFSDCDSLTSITIPNSVTTIGSYAFSCNSLTIYCEAASAPCDWHGEWNDDSPVIWNCNNNNKDNDGYEYAVIKGIRYSLKDNVATVIGQPSNISVANIPSKVTYSNKEYVVTTILSYAFSGCSNLASITIPSSVTTIGMYAFSGCSNLASITIPNSVTTIGMYAFSGCSNLASINYLGTIESWCNIQGLDNLMEYGTNSKTFSLNGVPVTELVIPDTVTNIPSYAFAGTNVTSITIPSSVTSIGSSAFYNCNNLASVTIGNGVTTIGERAFYDCDNLTNVTIPNSVTSIGEYAFRYCSNLASINYLGTIESWCAGNIQGLNYLMNYGSSSKAFSLNGVPVTELVIPNTVTSIPFYAFAGTNITSITIPDSVTSIGSYAFYNCNNLASVTIGNGVTTIGSSAFSYCDSLTSVTIGNSVTTIGEYTFRNCSNLASVTIGDSVTEISDYAFSGCTNLTSVTMGNSVTTIGKAAFRECSSLTSITIPNSVTTIDQYAFYNCNNLTSVTIGNSVTTIGEYAFRYCDNLTNVTISNSVTTIGSHAFSDCRSLTSINYLGTIESWCQIEGIYGVMAYGTNSKTFSLNGVPVTELVIPNTVTSIPSYAFERTNITSITIPDSVTSIGSSAFYVCRSLASINYLGTIESWCNIQGLRNLMEYGTNSKAFSLNGVPVTELVIPNTVTSIPFYAFAGTNITSITIPDSVTSIGSYAFYNCNNLASVTIGNGVTTIGEEAFRNCSNLSVVKFEGTVEQWKNISKGSYWQFKVPATKVTCSDGEVDL